MPGADPSRTEHRIAVAVAVVRATLLALAAVLVGFGPGGRSAAPWLLAVGAAAAVATATAPGSRPNRLATAVEPVVTALAVPLGGGAASPLLPYLLAPMFAIGFRLGTGPVVAAGGVVVATLAAGVAGETGADRVGYAVEVGQWAALAAALGLLAAWARSLLALGVPDSRERFVAAYRLLSELRGVARRLPASLDPVSAAGALLDGCAAAAPAVRRSAVLVPTSVARLAPLLVRGAERLDVDLATDGAGPVGTAWRTGEVVREVARERPEAVVRLVVPISADGTPTAAVLLESDERGAFPPADVARVTGVVHELAPRLESALVFDEVRTLATVEERQRLAREIHDGIAQDLTYVGYGLDDALAELDTGGAGAAEALRRVRAQVTRLISELRLSIFDLRATVDPQSGLGAALSEYVRTVGTGSGMTVHLSFAESAGRLRPDVEAELLRIAQEAIGNARRHSGARNLWVTLVLDPPRARLSVEDDGEGISPQHSDGFGLEIMRERAARLGARFAVTARQPRGTRVDLALEG